MFCAVLRWLVPSPPLRIDELRIPGEVKSPHRMFHMSTTERCLYNLHASRTVGLGKVRTAN